MTRIIALFTGLLMLAACTQTERGAVAGGALGAGIAAVSGASAGGIVAATAGGAAVGALIGRSTERRGYCRYRGADGRIYEARCN